MSEPLMLGLFRVQAWNLYPDESQDKERQQFVEECIDLAVEDALKKDKLKRMSGL